MTIEIQDSRRVSELTIELQYRISMHAADRAEKDLLLEKFETSFVINRLFGIGLIFFHAGLVMSVAMGSTTALMCYSVVALPLMAAGLYSSTAQTRKMKERLGRLAEWRHKAILKHNLSMDGVHSFGK